MPRISDHNEYLKANMVSDRDIIVLQDEGVFREPEETGLSRTVFQIRVRLSDGRSKTWSMNKTTRNRLARAYGDDSANWVNKNVKIQILQQNVRGEIKDILYGHPVPQQQPVQTGQVKRAVRFIKAFEAYKTEDIANLPKGEADSLIMLGFARPVDATK